MKTKQEYIDALGRMKQVYYNCAFKGGNCHGEKIKWLASRMKSKHTN